MKTAPLLLSFAYHPLVIQAGSRVTRTPAPFALSMPKSFVQDSILNLRGGDLGSISSNTLGKTFAILAAGDALAGTIKPVEVWDKFGVKVEPGSKGEHYLGHGLGSSAASLAVTGYLALSGKTSINEAIAYGVLTRCAYMTEMLLTGKYTELDVPTMPHVAIYLVLLVTAFGLLTGDSDYVALAKVVSTVLAGHGALLFLNPRIDDDEKAKKMAKVDGGYMLISSLFAALLTFGVKPDAAMGYSAIFCIPLFLSVLDLITVDKLFGLSTKAWSFFLVVFISASAYGMLT